MKSEITSLKNIISELDFLRKTVIIQWNAWKKNGVACKQIIGKKISDPCKQIDWKNIWSSTNHS